MFDLAKIFLSIGKTISGAGQAPPRYARGRHAVTVSARVPECVWKYIREQAKAKGVPPTHLVAEALYMGLGLKSAAAGLDEKALNQWLNSVANKEF